MKKILFLAAFSIALIGCKKDTCDDGELNQDETAIDCGGVCTPCPTCADGILNQDETAIDCGGSCNACGLTYPASGFYGINILDETTLNFPSTGEYSLNAIVPTGSSILVKFQHTGPDFGAIDMWGYALGTDQNLLISSYDSGTGQQTFQSTGGDIDLNFSFIGSASATISIYENGATTPTRTKNITWG